MERECVIPTTIRNCHFNTCTNNIHNKNIAKNRNKLINKYILTKITDLTRD